jgi:hypothetical protein
MSADAGFTRMHSGQQSQLLVLYDDLFRPS